MVHTEDITERRQAQQALNRSDAHLRRAQEVAHAGSWELDLIRGGLFWSDEIYRIFGLSRETPIDYDTFLNCVLPEDRKHVDGSWQAALAGAPYDIEHRIRAGGGVKWVREKAEVEFDQAGRAMRGVGIIQDITERKLADQQLMEYQRRLQSLASQLTLAEEQERRRIAADLHDDVGQTLALRASSWSTAREDTSDPKVAAVLDEHLRYHSPGYS